MASGDSIRNVEGVTGHKLCEAYASRKLMGKSHFKNALDAFKSKLENYDLLIRELKHAQPYNALE
jgi:hypothetical protein